MGTTCWVTYFIFYAALLLTHDSVPNVSQVERHIRGMLEGTTYEGVGKGPILSTLPVSGHKILEDLDTPADFWTYLQDVIIPLFIPPEMDAPDTVQYRALRYNTIVGDIRLQQVRKEKKQCSDAYPDLGPFDEESKNPLLQGFWCYPSRNMVSNCFGPGAGLEGFCAAGSVTDGRRLRATQASSARAAKKKMGAASREAFSADGQSAVYNVLLNQHDGRESALERIKILRDNDWIDSQTAWLGIRILFLNPDLGIFSNAMAHVFIAPSGEMVGLTNAWTFQAAPYESMGVIAADVMFVLTWLVLCVLFVKKVRSHTVSMKETLADKWMQVDCVIIMCGFVIIFLWLYYTFWLSDLHGDVANVARGRQAFQGISRDDTSAWANAEKEYSQARDALALNLLSFCDYLDNTRICYAWYAIMLTFRFVPAFEVQPRLLIIARTLELAFTDLVHFFIIFFTMLFAATISGMFYFGHRVSEFSDPSTAFEKCFQLILGDFNFDELAEESQLFAVGWLALFMSSLVFVMLNMLLAIILDKYAMARTEAVVTSPTILQQLWSLPARLRRSAQSPHRYRDVLKALEKVNTEEITKKNLLNLCPWLTYHQVENMLRACRELELHQLEMALSITDATKLVVSIKSSVKNMAEVLNVLSARRKGRERSHERAKAVAQKLGVEWDASMPPPPERLDAASHERLLKCQERTKHLEEFLHRAMGYGVRRLKESNSRLILMENTIRENLQMSPLDVQPEQHAPELRRRG